MNKLFTTALFALVAVVGCAPPPKSVDEWHGKINELMEARRPQFAECWAKERARVDALPNDISKQQLEAFLKKRVVVSVRLSVPFYMDPYWKEDPKTKIWADTEIGGEGITLVDQPHGGTIDGPLFDCVAKLMKGMPTPFVDYPSNGIWRVIYDPNLAPAQPTPKT